MYIRLSILLLDVKTLKRFDGNIVTFINIAELDWGLGVEQNMTVFNRSSLGF